MKSALLSIAFKRWKLLLIPAIAGLAFLMGRGCRPEPEVRVDEKVQYVDRVEVREVVKEVKVRDEAEVRVVWRTKVVTPDGTVRESERAESRSESTERTDTTGEREASHELEAESTRELVVSPSRPDWRVSALVGTQVGIMPLALSPPVYGAHVERRILGPFSVGVWGLTSGTFGLSVSGEF